MTSQHYNVYLWVFNKRTWQRQDYTHTLLREIVITLEHQLLSLLSTPTCLNSAALTQRRAPARGYFRDNASSLLSKSIDHIKRWFLVIRIAREANNTSWIMLRVDTQTRIATAGTLKCRVNIQSIIFIQHVLMNTLQNVAETFLKYSRASYLWSKTSY